MASVAEINELRKKTGAGMMDCKEALNATNGNVEEAISYLRKKGLADIKERTAKKANEGMVGHYIHMGGRIGVMVEVNCETDFVSRSPDFQTFAKDVAMHIAAANPKWLSRDEVPRDIVEREVDIIRSNMTGKKPPEVEAKIIDGRLAKFYRETCLLDQTFVRDEGITISELLGALASKINEKIVIRRFMRFETGEGL